MSRSAMLAGHEAQTWLRMGLWLGALATAMIAVGLWYPFFSLPEEEDGQAMVFGAFAGGWMGEAIILLLTTATLAFFLPPVWLTVAVCLALWFSLHLSKLFGTTPLVLMSFYAPMIGGWCWGLLARIRRDRAIGHEALNFYGRRKPSWL